MNRIVRSPESVRRSRARSITARTSATPDVTAESSSKRARVTLATMRASDVFPLPAGP